MKPIALYYLDLLDDIRAVGRAFGYAIGLHGSLVRDFDLIACPWIDEARPVADLVEAIRAMIGGYVAIREVGHDGATQKPHGRVGYAIHFPYKAGQELSTHAYIDLSVMPRVAKEIAQCSPASPA